MSKGYYADPTAWEAIARADKRPRNNSEAHIDDLHKGADGTCRIGVYHAPGAKTGGNVLKVFRPERISFAARCLKVLETERLGETPLHEDTHPSQI